MSLRRIALAALALTTAACADVQTTAPVAPEVPRGIDMSLLGVLTTRTADTTKMQFTVDPTSSTTFQVGSGHVVYFPSYSICDPSVSTYGPTEWDKSCTALTHTIVITAKSWTDASGLPHVDFSPNMRFRTNYSGENVLIGLAVDATTIATAADRLKILYCANPLAVCVDESLLDASLKTTVSAQYGAAYRRIKHFSGYNISSGRAEIMDLSLSKTATQPGTSVATRTGHLMSSGRQK